MSGCTDIISCHESYPVRSIPPPSLALHRDLPELFMGLALFIWIMLLLSWFVMPGPFPPLARLLPLPRQALPAPRPVHFTSSSRALAGRNGFQVRHYGPLRDPHFARGRFAASYRCKMVLRRVNLRPRRVLGPPQAPAFDPLGVWFPHHNTTGCFTVSVPTLIAYFSDIYEYFRISF